MLLYGVHVTQNRVSCSTKSSNAKVLFFFTFFFEIDKGSMLSQDVLCYITIGLLLIIIALLAVSINKMGGEGYAQDSFASLVSMCSKFGGLNEKDPKKQCSVSNTQGKCYLNAQHNRCEPKTNVVVPTSSQQRRP